MKIGPLSAARARLTVWGACIRSVAALSAPHGGYYSKQPFCNERVNFDFAAVDQEIFRGLKFDRAIETDQWLEPIKKNNPTTYTALIIRYVEREKGGYRRLGAQSQIWLFNQKTGLGKDAYYGRLTRAETYISMQLGASD